jgi:hypothetical protein
MDMITESDPRVSSCHNGRRSSQPKYSFHKLCTKPQLHGKHLHTVLECSHVLPTVPTSHTSDIYPLDTTTMRRPTVNMHTVLLAAFTAVVQHNSRCNDLSLPATLAQHNPVYLDNQNMP